MFWNKKKPTVRFRWRDDLVDAFPRPQRSSKHMPKWLQGLSRDMPGTGSMDAGTVKRCVPVLDAVKSGYIISLWADLLITIGNQELKDSEGNVIGMEPTLNWQFPSNFGMGEMIGHHGWQQVGDDCPNTCLLYTSPSPRDRTRSRMPSSA